MRHALWMLLAIQLGEVACSGADANTTGTEGANQGNAGSNLGTNAAGGVPAGGASGNVNSVASIGGKSASSNIGSAAGGSPVGATSAPTADCPKWPQSKLLPTVGVFFYGPDPGPCSTQQIAPSASNLDGTYHYDGGHLLSVSYSDGTSLQNTWQGELLLKTAYGTATDNYAFSIDKVVVTNGSGSQTYYLDANGYPLSVELVNASGTKSVAQYRYENCRIVRRELYSAASALLPDQTVGYAYDSVGHMISKRYVNGYEEQFDYSCWKAP